MSSAACVEVGKFGMEGEIEMLKRDKNVLMQELVRLRQQQQAADNQLDILGKRLHGMERRQQMMMSFLAKAMQNPGLFTQLMQQNESNRHIAGVKKRRLPRQDKSAAPDGQIVKYEPLMNGSPSAMLAQMLKFDSSPKLDEPMNNFPSHGGNSLDQNSGVTLGEVPQNSGVHPFVPATSAFPSACSSSASSHEIQSEAGITDITIHDALQDIDMLSEVPVAIPCEFPEIHELVPDESIADIPIDGMYLNQIAEEVDGPMPMTGTNDDQKFSEIMDSLLEEFISSP
ncbi:uncharacterized protein A4U43_C04F11920 [Asparagus officinalis]|uniref:HSF-type DNA-binding domain-containing protein n=2 Tax=Asparagus officinalis TaxID=4686 RepID=A0A5P1F0V4_ASPOF|nr:uncharacterized protein A4U43_C04F11920 [Asparagus officinalis]